MNFTRAFIGILILMVVVQSTMFAIMMYEYHRFARFLMDTFTKQVQRATTLELHDGPPQSNARAGAQD